MTDSKKIRQFQRRFSVEAMETHFRDSSSLIGALFDRWALPGQPAELVRCGDPPPLRLAIRDGYINFYANGQSVAKLSTPYGKPRIELAKEYLKNAGTFLSPSRVKDGIARFEADGLRPPAPGVAIAQLIENTAEHRSAEKCFVEHLLSRNPNIIDIEMALPGHPDLKKENKAGEERMFAPRMDIVLVQIVDDNSPSIEFWEAKLANNGELRATLKEKGGEAPPHICGQLGNYERWMNTGTGRDNVAEAYRATAGLLLELASRAGKRGEATRFWRALEKGKPCVQSRPGIVVGNYDPEDPEFDYIPRAGSFADYRAVLEKTHGFRVVEIPQVKGGEFNFALPRL